MSNRSETQNQIQCQTAPATRNASSGPQQRRRVRSPTSTGKEVPQFHRWCQQSARFQGLLQSLSFTDAASKVFVIHKRKDPSPDPRTLPREDSRRCSTYARISSCIFEHEVKVKAAMVRLLTANFEHDEPRFVELRTRAAGHVGTTDQGGDGGGLGKPRHPGSSLTWALQESGLDPEPLCSHRHDLSARALHAAGVVRVCHVSRAPRPCTTHGSPHREIQKSTAWLPGSGHFSIKKWLSGNSCLNGQHRSTHCGGSATLRLCRRKALTYHQQGLVEMTSTDGHTVNCTKF